MIDHKELWNMIVNSRRVWPNGHFLHDLDCYVFSGMAILVGIAFLVYTDWDLRRMARKLEVEIKRGDFLITVEEYNRLKKGNP